MISLLSIVAIGFFLGMRHATDADHVIAVSTIVSRQQSPWRAALIGGVWGIGHTLTIFAVGMAIILFNLVIPARLGLTMELSVGVMLIALGVWNVASFLHARRKQMRKSTRMRTPMATTCTLIRTDTRRRLTPTLRSRHH